MNSKIQLSPTFIKYTIINGGLTLAYFIIYYGLIEYAKVDYIISNVIAYVITVTLAYIFTKYYAFESQKRSVVEVILFIIVRISMLAFSSLGIKLGVEVLHIGYYASFIIVTFLCFVVSYLLNRLIFVGKRFNG